MGVNESALGAGFRNSNCLVRTVEASEREQALGRARCQARERFCGAIVLLGSPLYRGNLLRRNGTREWVCAVRTLTIGRSGFFVSSAKSGRLA